MMKQIKKIVVAGVLIAMQIGTARAALEIHSDQAGDRMREAKKACAMATQSAMMNLVDPTTIVNLERLAALCIAAAGQAVPPRKWPEETAPQNGLPYDAKGLFDAQNLSEGMKALFECRQLAEKRAAEGKVSLGLTEIKTIAQVTKPSGGLAVFDPEATAAFIEIRLMCFRARNLPGTRNLPGN